MADRPEVQYRRAPNSIARSRRFGVRREDIDVGARGGGEGDGQQPDRARPADQDSRARSGLRRRHGALGVAAGFDQRARPVVNARRQPVQAVGGGQHLLSQRPRPGGDPDLVPVRADVPVSRPAAVARPQPSMVSPVTRAPSHASSTPAPTAETTPHHSCPGRSGKRDFPCSK